MHLQKRVQNGNPIAKETTSIAIYKIVPMFLMYIVANKSLNDYSFEM
jgi:hypothetical protein